jgi:predicted thioesterase
MASPSSGAPLLLRAGDAWQRVYTVDAEAVATRWGGDSDVLATPVIVYWIESLATACIREAGAGRHRSLGHAISMRHLAQAPAGSAVVLDLRLLIAFGNSLRFTAQVSERPTGTIIAQGTHDRTVVAL